MRYGIARLVKESARRFFGSRRPTPPLRVARPTTFKPTLEILEDRAAPTSLALSAARRAWSKG